MSGRYVLSLTSLRASLAAVDLDVPYDAREDPLPDHDAVKVQQLQLPLLAKDDVIRRDDQEVARQGLVDALLDPVVHVVAVVVVGEVVDVDPVRELDGKPVPEDGHLLHVIPALYSDLLVGQEVLHDDVRHVLPVSVPLLVQAVDGLELEVDDGDASAVVAEGDGVVRGPALDGPDPLVPGVDDAQLRTLLGAQPRLLITPANKHILPIPIIINAAGVKAELAVLLVLDARELVEG